MKNPRLAEDFLGKGRTDMKSPDRRGNRAVVCFMVVLWAWGGIVRGVA